jgi:hypothetical protein
MPLGALARYHANRNRALDTPVWQWLAHERRHRGIRDERVGPKRRTELRVFFECTDRFVELFPARKRLDC